jgi:hypothetical protein
MFSYKELNQHISQYVQRLRIPDMQKNNNYTLPQLLGFVDPGIPYQTEVLYKDLIFKHEYLLHKEIYIKYSDLDELTPLCLKLFHSWVHFHKTPFYKPWTVWDIMNLRNFAFKHRCQKFWYYYRWQISVWMQNKKRVGYAEQLLKLIPEMYYVNYYSWYKHFNHSDKLMSYIKPGREIIRVNPSIIKFLKNASPISDEIVINNLVSLACIRKFDFSKLGSEPIEGVCRYAWYNDFYHTKWELFQHPLYLRNFDSIPSLYFRIDQHDFPFLHFNRIYKLSLILPLTAIKIFIAVMESYEYKIYKLHNFDRIQYYLDRIISVLTINRETYPFKMKYFKIINKIKSITHIKYLPLYNTRLAFLLSKLPSQKRKHYEKFTINGIEFAYYMEDEFKNNPRLSHYNRFISRELFKKYQ